MSLAEQVISTGASLAEEMLRDEEFMEFVRGSEDESERLSLIAGWVLFRMRDSDPRLS